MKTPPPDLLRQIGMLKVLVVDDEPTMRKVTRSLLQAIGIKKIYEAGDGDSGLDAIASHGPDVVLLDWEMPRLNGVEFVRKVRDPEHFPFPDVPIIMLTAYSERSRVLEAVKVGINEYLLKPVSSTALLARLIEILTKPRRMVKKGNYYGPEPRKPSSHKPSVDYTESEVAILN